MSVLQNPGSPLSVALPLVGLCTRAELLDLARASDVPVLVRITANELVDRRPPVSEPPTRSSRAPRGSLRPSLEAPDSEPDSDTDPGSDPGESGPVLQ